MDDAQAPLEQGFAGGYLDGSAARLGKGARFAFEVVRQQVARRRVHEIAAPVDGVQFVQHRRVIRRNEQPGRGTVFLAVPLEAVGAQAPAEQHAAAVFRFQVRVEPVITLRELPGEIAERCDARAVSGADDHLLRLAGGAGEPGGLSRAAGESGARDPRPPDVGQGGTPRVDGVGADEPDRRRGLAGVLDEHDASIPPSVPG